VTLKDYFWHAAKRFIESTRSRIKMRRGRLWGLSTPNPFEALLSVVTALGLHRCIALSSVTLIILFGTNSTIATVYFKNLLASSLHSIVKKY
jgi:hypothetical protein